MRAEKKFKKQLAGRGKGSNFTALVRTGKSGETVRSQVSAEWVGLRKGDGGLRKSAGGEQQRKGARVERDGNGCE
jgi:hypothetical protein